MGHDGVAGRSAVRKNCIICQAPFLSSHWAAVSCSDACRQIRKLQVTRKWREDNPEYVKAQNRQWRQEHPEQHRALTRKWCEENRERLNATAQAWKEKNREKVRGYNRKWAKAQRKQPIQKGQ